MSESEEESKPKKKRAKFRFKCQRCDQCCLTRGPIPITLWDLEMWARNQVLSNFLPYLEVYTKPDGGVDLIIKPLTESEDKEKNIQENPEEAFKETPIEELLDKKCPLYSKDQEQCLVYENRPLSCRTYPLEYDGKNFSIVDLDCPGIGEEGMTKEELKEMRDTAKTMNYELTRIRIGLPVLNQIISRKVMMDLMRQNMQAMSQMSDEDKAKLNDILGKGQEQPPS
ncbi:MAG: YkgJ family cysteine cluster protein [Promethearchaeota archaeon]|nr:MAG: YkgJ family cysteine cluster protein [Candidatus Lokiarchaeota archaeon]